MANTDAKIHFIRHAQSSFNDGLKQFQKEKDQFKNLNFDELSKFPIFREKVRFSLHHVDSPLTINGKNECKKTQNFLNQMNIKPDLILVSPLNRTLETCYEIFGHDYNFPIIVEPLIGQILKSSCDISHQIKHKKIKYHLYDFQQCQKLGDHWYIKKNSLRHQQIYKHIFENSQILTTQGIVKMVLKLMDQRDAVQTQHDLLQRCQRAIKNIHMKYASKYKQIVIITHFKFIQCISATKFDQNCMPIDGIKAQNGQIHSVKLIQILQKFQK